MRPSRLPISSRLPIYGYRGKLNGYKAIKIPIDVFWRQLRELGIINTSRALVAYFSKKFANRLKLNAEATMSVLKISILLMSLSAHSSLTVSARSFPRSLNADLPGPTRNPSRRHKASGRCGRKEYLQQSEPRLPIRRKPGKAASRRE